MLSAVKAAQNAQPSPAHESVSAKLASVSLLDTSGLFGVIHGFARDIEDLQARLEAMEAHAKEQNQAFDVFSQPLDIWSKAKDVAAKAKERIAFKTKAKPSDVIPKTEPKPEAVVPGVNNEAERMKAELAAMKVSAL